MTTAVTDEQVRERAATAVPYSLALLWWDDDRFQDGADVMRPDIHLGHSFPGDTLPEPSTP